MSKTPVIFISHGAPTMALESNKRPEYLHWAETIPKPSAILVVSAHWETPGLVLGTTTSKDLIYDFSGFPAELYQVQYPAPGAPRLAQRISQLFQSKDDLEIQYSDRGWDHGVWVPLVLMYPEADIPVLQISLPTGATARQLYNLGNTLAPLREEGVLIMGSGQITHNLSALSAPNANVVQWARTFDNWCKETLDSRDWNRLIDYQHTAPELKINHPTDEHFKPLLIATGSASNPHFKVEYPVEGFEYGSLSRRSVQFS